MKSGVFAERCPALNALERGAVMRFYVSRIMYLQSLVEGVVALISMATQSVPSLPRTSSAPAPELPGLGPRARPRLLLQRPPRSLPKGHQAGDPNRHRPRCRRTGAARVQAGAGAGVISGAIGGARAGPAATGANIQVTLDGCPSGCQQAAVAGVMPASAGSCPADLFHPENGADVVTFWTTGTQSANGTFSSGPRTFGMNGAYGQRICVSVVFLATESWSRIGGATVAAYTPPPPPIRSRPIRRSPRAPQ